MDLSQIMEVRQGEFDLLPRHRGVVRLDAQLIEGFTAKYLLSKYDSPVPIPDFHRSMWEVYCRPDTRVLFAAPRSHAKSTGITHTCALAELCFGTSDYILLVSDTEGQASLFLQDIAREFNDNELLRQDFGFKGWQVESKTELEGEFTHGYFRIEAKGAEQRIRGRKWRNKRPNLILIDDLESDEAVENQERRAKLRRWFYNALLPALSDTGRMRYSGTVLHFDSLLYRLLHDPGWTRVYMKSHNEDYSQILWADRFPELRLRSIKAQYARDHNLAGYSQEYLNHPIDESDSYFMKDDVKYVGLDEVPSGLTYYSAADFAISSKLRADFTVMATMGYAEDGMLYVVDIQRGKWDSLEIMNKVFNIHKQYSPELFVVEDGAIYKTLSPMLKSEMFQRREFPRVYPVTPIQDKETRARPLQFRFRADGVRIVKADWNVDLEMELLQFPRGKHDDQVDALAWITRVLDKLIAIPASTPYKGRYEEDGDMTERGTLNRFNRTGTNSRTGY